MVEVAPRAQTLGETLWIGTVDKFHDPLVDPPGVRVTGGDTGLSVVIWGAVLFDAARGRRRRCRLPGGGMSL